MNNFLLTIAWRNLWRNKRRSLITIASIFFSVFFAIGLQGYHLGIWNRLLDGVLHSYTGYLQIHASGYWKNKSLDYSFQFDEEIRSALSNDHSVKQLIPRLESPALASSGDKTKAVLVAGIDPDPEFSFTAMREKLKKGRLLTPADQGVMLSERLALFLGLEPGDTLVLVSQGYQGNSAQGLFPVVGIVKLPSPEWDNMMVYMPLQSAQSFYSAEKLITSLLVDVEVNQYSESLTLHLKSLLDPGKYEVMSWKEMLTELYQQWRANNAAVSLILGLLYLIIGFGIFGTIMMMMHERRYEFGMMLAVGMKPARLSVIIAAEILLLATTGVLAGIACSVPFAGILHHYPFTLEGEKARIFAQFGMEPVLQILWHWKYIFGQALAVYLITLITAIYPVLSVFRIKPVKALRLI